MPESVSILIGTIKENNIAKYETKWKNKKNGGEGEMGPNVFVTITRVSPKYRKARNGVSFRIPDFTMIKEEKVKFQD